MTFDPGNQQGWNDFIHTVTVMLGRAQAVYDTDEAIADKAKAAGRTVSHSFTFSKLAADTEPNIVSVFEQASMEARNGGMTADIEQKDGVLLISFQLVGYPMLKMAAGSQARLISQNGLIDQELLFSLEGRAQCEIADTHELREALNDYSVEILA